MLRVWKLHIRPDPDAPDMGQGYAIAASGEEARLLAGNPPGLLVFETRPETLWPGQPGRRAEWSWRASL